MDLKLSVRQLLRRPVFTLTAVLTLAIGMGVNTVAFTVVNGILFKAPSIGSVEGMGRIVTTPGGDESGNASIAEYQRFVDATRGALDLAAEGRLPVAWQHEGTIETAYALFVSSNYFSIVNARAIAGRIEVGADADGSISVLIGERFWRNKLNRASIVGLTLRLNDTTVDVAGVVAESFTGPAGTYSPDVWLPLGDLALFNASPRVRKRDLRWLFLFGRRQQGVSVPEVQGRVDTAVAAMADDWPESHSQRGALFRPLGEFNSELRGLSVAGAAAMGVMGLVLLLACFNVTNLLLARAVERERDMAIRAAIGAGSLRLVRLLGTEGVVLAGLAGATALALAAWTQSLVGSFAIPIEVPQHIDLTPDANVVGFILVVVLIAGVVPGLWPAFRVARLDVVRVLGSQGANAAGGRPSPMRHWLVGAQIAGSTAFLATAALFAQSYANVSVTDLGFQRDNLLVAEFELASHGYDADRAERYAQALLARVRALPGVVDGAVADRVPFFVGFDRVTPVSSASAPCEPSLCPKHATLAVGPGYFKTMGISLAAGREFEERGAPTEIIINQPLAELHWPAGRGLGETLRVGVGGMSVTVIGITGRTNTRVLNREAPTLYVPLVPDDFEGLLSIVARTASAPESLIRPFADAAQSLDPDVALLSLKTMEERVAIQLWPYRTISWLFSICAALALILSTVGLAGAVVHGVNRRLREFGVRLSLGATRRDLVIDVLKSTGTLLLPGLVVGTMLAAAAARLARAAFVGVNVLNPLLYLVVALLEAVIVIVACLGPALRASRVDPLMALRSD